MGLWRIPPHLSVFSAISLILLHSCAFCKPPPPHLFPSLLIFSPCSVMQNRSDACCAMPGFKAAEHLSHGFGDAEYSFSRLGPSRSSCCIYQLIIINVLQTCSTHSAFPVTAVVLFCFFKKQIKTETETMGDNQMKEFLVCRPPVHHQLHDNLNAMATESRGSLHCSHGGP